MNRLKEKYYIALGNLQNMAIDNTKGSKGVDICVLDINEYVAYLQSKIDKAIEYIEGNIDLEMDDFTKIDIGCEILKILDLDKYNEFLKEDK